MAKFQNTNPDFITGKIGPVVLLQYRGQGVIRSYPRKSTQPPTLVQQITRENFKVVSRFLSPLRHIINSYYKETSGTKSEYNLATSYYMKEAVTGIYPNLSIDHSKAIC